MIVDLYFVLILQEPLRVFDTKKYKYINSYINKGTCKYMNCCLFKFMFLDS